MAVAFVANVGSEAVTAPSSTGQFVSVSTNVPAGQWIIAHLAIDNAAAAGAAVTVTASDSKGNTWTVVAPQNRTPTANANDGTTNVIAYCYVTTSLLVADSDGPTFLFSGSLSARAISLDAFTGIDVASPVAVAVVGTSGNTTSPTALARTATAAGQLVYGAIAIEGEVADGYTEDADTTNGSWVALTPKGAGTGTVGQTTRAVYKIVSASGAQSWQPTLGVARDRASQLLIFAASTDLTSFGTRATITATPGAGSPSVAPAGATAALVAAPHAGAPSAALTGATSVEADAPHAGTPLVATAGSRASEADLPATGSPLVAVPGSVATEAEVPATGVPLAVLPGTAAAEVDAPSAGAPLVAVDGSRAGEVDVAAPGDPTIVSAGSQAAESDAPAAGLPHASAGGFQATEVDLPLGGGIFISALGSAATELDTANAGEPAGGTVPPVGSVVVGDSPGDRIEASDRAGALVSASDRHGPRVAASDRLP